MFIFTNIVGIALSEGYNLMIKERYLMGYPLPLYKPPIFPWSLPESDLYIIYRLFEIFIICSLVFLYYIGKAINDHYKLVKTKSEKEIPNE